MRFVVLGCATSWGCFVLLGGCGQTVIVGMDDTSAPGGFGAGVGGTSESGSGGLTLGGGLSTPDAGSPGEGGAPACVEILCRGKSYECGDCIDNEGDGKLDSADPECLGPCDDDETGLSTGLKPSGGRPCRLDCYFDADAGSGNDKCEWSQQCDPLSIAPSYPPSGEERCAYDAQGGETDCQALTEQPSSCVAACLPLVPNGCDCFGCCELPSRSGQYHFVGRGRGAAGCELGTLDDPAACPPCTPVDSCLNACDPCEQCVGGEPDPSCQTPAACPNGDACSSSAPCPFGDYCVTGCCARAPVPT